MSKLDLKNISERNRCFKQNINTVMNTEHFGTNLHQVRDGEETWEQRFSLPDSQDDNNFVSNMSRNSKLKSSD